MLKRVQLEGGTIRLECALRRGTGGWFDLARTRGRACRVRQTTLIQFRPIVRLFALGTSVFTASRGGYTAMLLVGNQCRGPALPVRVLHEALRS
jgi:hypothetical protein